MRKTVDRRGKDFRLSLPAYRPRLSPASYFFLPVNLAKTVRAWATTWSML
jgi:hypothetical protein